MGISNKKLLIGLACVLGMLGVLLIASRVMSAKKAMEDSRKLGAIFKISRGLWAYREVHGRYPTPSAIQNGHPVSWRVQLETFMRETFAGDSEEYDLAHSWNSEANQVFASSACHIPFSLDDSNRTEFLAVTGTGTAFGNEQPLAIQDGDENTVVLVQSTTVNPYWMEPVDVDAKVCEISSGAFVLFADGLVCEAMKDLDEEVCLALFTISGEEPLSRDELVMDGALLPRLVRRRH